MNLKLRKLMAGLGREDYSHVQISLEEGRCYSCDVCCTSVEKGLRSTTSIAFIEEDLKEVTVPHHDPLVITPIIGRRDEGKSRLTRVLVNTSGIR